MSVDAFKHALLKVSNQLTQPQLKEMLYLCPFIGRGRQEKITKGYELFEVLTERKKIQPDDTAFLSDLLTKVGRQDLCDQLSPTGNCGPAGSPDDPNDAEGVSITRATEVIADYLGKDWRRLARKLGLTEVKIKNIERRCQGEGLEEVARAVVGEWRRAQRGGATVEGLLVALRGCELNLTAEKVEERLRGASER